MQEPLGVMNRFLVDRFIYQGIHRPRRQSGTLVTTVRLPRDDNDIITYRLGGVTVHRIEDQISLAQEMARRAKAKQWERDWIVVTEILRAERAVVLVCQSDRGSAEFSLGADVGVAGLKALTANANVSFTHDDQLATKVFGDRMTPLFRAVRVRRKFFVGPHEVAPAFAVDLEELASADQPDPDQILEDIRDYEDEDAG